MNNLFQGLNILDDTISSVCGKPRSMNKPYYCGKSDSHTYMDTYPHQNYDGNKAENTNKKFHISDLLP